MKPESILKIEKDLGVEFKEIKKRNFYTWGDVNGYLLNDFREVIGISISDNEFVNDIDISFLKIFKSLEILNLRNNKISDYSILKGLIKLDSLMIYNNSVNDISFLKDLNKLIYLQIKGGQIDDFDSIGNLHNLIFLDISSQKVSNLAFLKNLNKLSTLNLTQTGISDVSILKDKFSLKVLFLGWNEISDISSLSKLIKLKALYIHNNDISDISFLENLTELHTLTLSENKLKDISKLKNLLELETLIISSNNIENFSYLKDLTKLKSLILSSNQIEDISFIKNLNNLEIFNASNNKIKDISYLKNLVRLSELNLGFNNISDISSLEKIDCLKNLDLKINDISDISHLKNLMKLKNLDLRSNKIKDISPLINLMKGNVTILNKERSGNGFYLNENPLDYPPIEIVNEGKEKILEWFKEIDKYGEEPLYESKLLIVGEPNAGKTSLRKKLVDTNYEIKDGEIQETIGVYVHDGYNFPYYKDNTITITSHIWDFGGQEKQYPLHQYFLKDKSVYALLSLDRGDNQYLDKWFSIIRLLSGNENEIILVLNQKNRTSQSSNFNKVKYENQGFKFKEHILDLSKDIERFEELKTNIQSALASLPHIGGLFPKYCKIIADEIDKKRFIDKKDYLTYEEYENLCLSLDFKKDDVPKKALTYLNITGKVIHYEDDCNLERIIIINPHWLIDAIYGVLTCAELDEFHEKGRFTKEWLIEYLKKPTEIRPTGYKESESLHILNLMLKNHFDICYEVGDVFLIPLCMPEIIPKDDFDINQSVQVLFKYEVMPSGMVARVLVRLNEYIEENMISKTSGILNNGKNRAKIEEYYLQNDANRYIRIVVNGNLNSRKEFLNLIKNELIKVQKV